MIFVKVERLSPDGLTRFRWVFYFLERRRVLLLDRFSIDRRKTIRHKFRVNERYDRLDPRNAYADLQAEDAPLPDDVIHQALAEFVGGIEVVRSLTKP